MKDESMKDEYDGRNVGDGSMKDGRWVWGSGVERIGKRTRGLQYLGQKERKFEGWEYEGREYEGREYKGQEDDGREC